METYPKHKVMIRLRGVWKDKAIIKTRNIQWILKRRSKVIPFISFAPHLILRHSQPDILGFIIKNETIIVIKSLVTRIDRNWKMKTDDIM